MFYAIKNCPKYTKSYVIKEEDNLYQIAKRHGTTLRQLMFINPEINPENLIIGTKICVPNFNQKPPCTSGNYYTVKPSDNLYEIARKNNISLQKLIMANNHIDPNNIRPGQEICIPTQTINCPYEKTHIVSKNDTLTKILMEYNISVNSLVEANIGLEPENISLGLKLCIPPSQPYKECPANKSYIIKEGDNIVKIAEKFIVSTDDILQYNPNMRPTDFEEVGIKICIPLEEVPV